MDFRRIATAALLIAACLPAAFSAPAIEESNSLEEKRQLASTLIAERLPVWQKRLKLQDWTVNVVLARRADLKQGTLGSIRWDKGKKTATIWALDASEYSRPASEMLKDLEFTIVHELVHLELASLPKKEASRKNEEIAVNQLTEALLELDRR